MLDAKSKLRIEACVGRSISNARRIERGYTPAERWLVSLTDGTAAFVKIGTNAWTSQALRLEHEAYLVIQGSFMAKVLGWQDDADRPLMVLEDLSRHRWPPAWGKDDVAAVLKSLEELHQLRLPLKPFREIHAEGVTSWTLVAADPQPFLSLELVSPDWLKRALPTLLKLEASAPIDGDSPTHWDVRSDNICLTDRGALLLDWNGACLSNPQTDIGFWLPSLHAEGGPEPETILPNSPEVAAWVCGFFAARAGLPKIPSAPKVREVQLQQLKPALAWVKRAARL